MKTDRIKKLQVMLCEHGLDGVVITHPKDLYYFAGVDVSTGLLWVAADNCTLIVDGRYYEACQAAASVSVALMEGGFIESLKRCEGVDAAATIGFDGGQMSFDEVQNWMQSFEGKDFKTISSWLSLIRLVKEESEIAALREAAFLGSQGWDYALSLLDEGVQEREVALELEMFWKKKGGERPAFPINVSFGANSALPHHRASSAVLQRGDIVLMDIGVKLGPYNSDMTRVVFYGEADPELEKVYQTVLAAQERALQVCKPGALIADADAAARDLIHDAGYGEFFTHSLGHGIGLDVHEWPYLRSRPAENHPQKLEAGMVVTIEPGIYLPGKGGVRIEDTIVITEEGYEDLTLRSKELCVIEK